eukprot:2862309-Amphidinium_carterae.2
MARCLVPPTLRHMLVWYPQALSVSRFWACQPAESYVEAMRECKRKSMKNGEISGVEPVAAL